MDIDAGRYPEIKRRFTLFIVACMVLLSTLVLLMAGGSLRTLVSENLETEQTIRVNEALRSLERYVRVRYNQLLDQRSIPLLTQAVLQPEALLPSAEDLMREMYLQQKLYQQKLLDFSGEVLYQRYPDERHDYGSAAWFSEVSQGNNLGVVDLSMAPQARIHFVVPLIYNHEPEGFLLTSIEWGRVIEESDLIGGLQGVGLLIGESDSPNALIIGQRLGDHWLSLGTDFLGHPVSFQVDHSHTSSFVFRHVITLMAVFLVAAAAITWLAVYWGQRLFVLPLNQLEHHAELLEKGRAKEVPIPEHASHEIVALINQFNQMSQRVHDRENQLKAANKRLVANQEQLVQSEKLASLGTMAAGVAHEINNPVAFVLSNMNTLQEYLEDVRQVAPAIDARDWQALQKVYQELSLNEVLQDSEALLHECRDGLQRVKEIASGLKRFAHTDTKQLEPVNIRHCLELTVKLLWNEIKHTAELRYQLDQEVIVHANEGQLSQVFMNILMNAVHAMEDRGVITIAVRRINSAVHISISDTGIGMNQETQKRLFEPFYTEKEVGVGTGLGMSISLGIVQGYGGTIEVSSSPGAGTTFTIILPDDNSGLDNK